MKPLSLTMRGFRHYRAEQTVVFPDGLFSITGPNAAGKSSILQAIDVALFGPEGRSLTPYVTWGEDRMLLDLEFHHADGTYRVRRESLRGKHLLDIEEHDDVEMTADAWLPLTRETVKESQAFLETLLGFTRSTLRASSLLMQGDTSSWVEADPRQRKQVLSDVLGLDRYGLLLDRARTGKRERDTRLATLAGQTDMLTVQAAPLDELRASVERLAGEITQVAGQHQSTVTELERLADMIAESEQADRQRRELTSLISQVEQRAAALRHIDVQAQVARERADQVRTEIAGLERLAAEHGELHVRVADMDTAARARQEALAEKQRLEQQYDQAVATAKRLLAEHAELVKHADDFDEEAAAIETGTVEECTQCGQPLSGEAREAAARKCRLWAAGNRADAEKLADEAASAHREAQALGQQVNALTVLDLPEGLQDTRARLAELADVPGRLAAAHATLTELDRTIMAADDPGRLADLAACDYDLQDARAALAAIEPSVGLDQARVEHTGLVARARALQTEHDQLRAKHTETRTLLELAETSATRLAELEQETARLTDERDLLADLERAYGPNGIPLLILENAAVPAIEQHANEMLARLALDYRVEIHTQTATKTGDLRDALDVVVTTGEGQATFEQLSGSEQTRVAVALRIALARLLAGRRGADCRLLVLDEPEGLDASSRMLLVDALRELEQARVFDQVAVVSHESDLRDAFDQVLAVERGSDGWSIIVGAREGVAA